MRLPVTVSPVIETIRTFGMPDERVADLRARAGQDVDDARGQDLGRGSRRTRGRVSGVRADGLSTTVLPVASAGPSFHAGHVERVVPRRDRGDDADRVAPDDRGVARRELVGGEAVHHPAGAREEPEEVGADGHLVDRGADRLAGVRALEPAELVAARLEGVGDLEQEQRAVLRASSSSRSGTRCRPRSTARSTSSAGAGRDARDGLVVGRVDDLGRAAVGGIDELAADELLVGLDALGDVGHRGVLLEGDGIVSVHGMVAPS